MPNMIKLPKTAMSAASSMAIAPGEYEVCIKRVAQPEIGRIGMLYEIVGTNEYQGVTLWDNFNPDHRKGAKMLLELLNAIGVAPENVADGEGVQFDADECVGKTLHVKVELRQDNGNTYINVVEHMPF